MAVKNALVALIGFLSGPSTYVMMKSVVDYSGTRLIVKNKLVARPSSIIISKHALVDP